MKKKYLEKVSDKNLPINLILESYNNIFSENPDVATFKRRTIFENVAGQKFSIWEEVHRGCNGSIFFYLTKR